MKGYAESSRENDTSFAASQQVVSLSHESPLQLVDERQNSHQLRKKRKAISQSSRVSQLSSLQEDIADRANTQHAPIQRKKNKTGLPDSLKSGIEGLSGYSMDDVKVHYNSPKPAQLFAHAYAQGTDIHLGPGQEKHLPHEAWHVVQQKQGRVRPTIQMKGGVEVNDDKSLEKEADVMGKQALFMQKIELDWEKPISPNFTHAPIAQFAGGKGTGPYGRDVHSGSPQNILSILFDLLEFLSIGLTYELSRLGNQVLARDTSGNPLAHIGRIAAAVARSFGRMFLRHRLALYVFGSLPNGSYYASMLLVYVLNWFYERLLVEIGTRLHGRDGVLPTLGRRYLGFMEGVETQGADYQVARRSGRRTGSTGRAMAASQGLTGSISAQESGGGTWGYLLRHFRLEWGHRQADSHRGRNTEPNLGAESLGANSSEMVDEAYALELNRAHPGQVRRRNVSLRYINTLLDRTRHISISVNRVPILQRIIHADRGPLTPRERSDQASYVRGQSSRIHNLVFSYSLFIPILSGILFLLYHLLF